jgi:hypothetical protein
MGTISSCGLYVAPSAPPVGGSVKVAAVSVADRSSQGSATVKVENLVAIAPAAATVVTGEIQRFTATVNGLGSSTVQWQVNGAAGGNALAGKISSSGLYTAPAAAPASPVTITAVDASDRLASASATVTVLLPQVLAAHDQWLAGVAAAAESYGCTDISIRQGPDEPVSNALNRFGLSAPKGSCLVLYPISTNPKTLRYSLASGGTIEGREILYLSDVGQMRIWDGVALAGN